MKRSQMEMALRRLDEENRDVHRQLGNMEQHVAQLESQHSQQLMSVTTNHRVEVGELIINTYSPIFYLSR